MLGESKNTRLIMWMNYLLSKSDQVIETLAKKDSIFQKVLDAERNFRTVPVGLRDLLSSLNFNWYYIKVKPIFTSVIKL